MAIEITIPRLGWSMDEGMFGEWLKQEGDRIEPGEPLFTLEGDKALQDIESVDAGTLHILPGGPQGGDTVRVGMLVGYLLAEGEETPAPSQLETKTQPIQQVAQESPLEPTATHQLTGPIDKATSPHAAEGSMAGRPAGSVARRNAERGLPSISPRAARVARELDFDWTHIVGSGQSGRIREQDVRAAANQVGSKRLSSTGSLRRTIARRMLESTRTIVPVTLTTRADATRLVELRDKWKRSQTRTVVPAYHDMIAKLSAMALNEHSLMNAHWIEEQLVASDAVHIGIAVHTEAGLTVPVVRDVNRLSIWEVAAASRTLAERARNRKCTKDELTGSTFTITNLGTFGIDAFTPVINAPEVAILGLGAIRREPVVEHDSIAIHDQVTLSLTFNHLAIDGAPVARFLQRLVSLIESAAQHLHG